MPKKPKTPSDTEWLKGKLAAVRVDAKKEKRRVKFMIVKLPAEKAREIVARFGKRVAETTVPKGEVHLSLCKEDAPEAEPAAAVMTRMSGEVSGETVVALMIAPTRLKSDG